MRILVVLVCASLLGVFGLAALGLLTLFRWLDERIVGRK